MAIQGITKPAIIKILHPGHHQACYLLHFYIQGITKPTIDYFLLHITSRASLCLLSITFYIQGITKPAIY